MAQRNYHMFQSPSQQVPYTFLYPADWQVREITSDEGEEVFIAGPRDEEETYTVSMTVRRSPASNETPEMALAAFLERYAGALGFRELGRASGAVAGHPAVEVEIVYTMPLPLNSVSPQMKRIRERHVFFKDDHSLVELIYAATDKMYDAWLSDFQILIQTFMLPEKSDHATFHSVVSPPRAVPLRDEQAPYSGGEAEDG